ncbi:MAG TPA: P1 family peptidase, partial [Candidatus Bathyarchaeia archaeon]|nr:P1 family peptidase [Candidatus Bathyarchaeia archaeon]
DYGGTPDPVGGGSCMLYIATDLDLNSRQLCKIAKRGMLGLARTGSYGGDGSGDFIIAFSTGKRDADGLYEHSFTEMKKKDHALNSAQDPKTEERWLNSVYQAVIEATEESVINALFKAETMVGRDGNTRHAIPLDRVQEILKKYKKL